MMTKMRNKLIIIGLVFLALITSCFALVYDGVNITTGTSNTTLVFDEAVSIQSVNITNTSLILTNIYYTNCAVVQPTNYFNQTLNTANSTTLSSTFSTLLCVSGPSYTANEGGALLAGYYVLFIFYSIIVISVTTLSLFLAIQLNRFKFIKNSIIGWVIIALFIEIMVLTISLVNLLLNSGPQ